MGENHITNNNNNRCNPGTKSKQETPTVVPANSWVGTDVPTFSSILDVKSANRSKYDMSRKNKVGNKKIVTKLESQRDAVIFKLQKLRKVHGNKNHDEIFELSTLLAELICQEKEGCS
jgi:hypothetical protein